VKGSERAILSGAVVLVLAVAFYMLVLSPKRAEVSELNDQIASLETSISQQEQVISFGQQARSEFAGDYGRMVVLGKAVPEQADTSSLMIELNSIADSTNVDFRGILLNNEASGEGTASAASTTPAPTTPPATGEAAAPATGEAAPATGEAASGTTASTTAATPAPAAPATEAGAANLPIGAVVGPAGLPTLPYKLDFMGGFFEIADYIGQVDRLVRFEGKNKVKVNGRLMTIDGFALKGGRPGSDPDLDASFSLTSYVTPSNQGLTAGATPSGPAPSVAPQTTPASTVTP
jgi:hypothetical protein